MYKFRPKSINRRSFYSLIVFVLLFAGIGGKLVFFSHAASINTQTDCFARPGSCGYPDPVAADDTGDVPNVGVANCSSLTTLTPSNISSVLPANTYYYSGSGNLLELDESNVTWSGINFANWQIYAGSGITHLTLNNDCLSFNGGGNGESVAITMADANSDLIVENSTVEGLNNSNESALLIGCGANCVINNDYLFNTTDAVTAGTGSIIENSYIDTNAIVNGEHAEDLYYKDASITLNHDTMLNPDDQTAEIFAEVSTSACDNGLTLTDSLLAGGGYYFYVCSGATTVGTSTTDIENNRFARCLGSSTYDSSLGGHYCGSTPPGSSGSAIGAGADNNGYWPGGGFFGFDADSFFTASSGQTWANNVWDDNCDLVNSNGVDGSYDSSCPGGGSSGSSSPPTVSLISPTSGTSVGGVVTLSATASASSPATVANVQFKANGVDMPSCDPTSPSSGSTYTCSWDTTAIANGTTNTVTALVTDSTGASTTSSSSTYTELPSGCSSLQLGDVDDNCVVAAHDLAILLTNYGQTVPANTRGDLDSNGVVSAHDLAILLTNYGE